MEKESRELCRYCSRKESSQAPEKCNANYDNRKLKEHISVFHLISSYQTLLSYLTTPQVSIPTLRVGLPSSIVYNLQV